MNAHEYKVVMAPIYGIIHPTWSATNQASMSKALTKLEQQVSTLLSEGWECKGGVVVDHTASVVLQAVTRTSVSISQRAHPSIASSLESD